MAEVRFVNIYKSYDKNEVLKNINLDIKNGEFVVILGPSGCGKTTLLRMLAGDIYIDNIKVNNIPPSKREIAMVFQDYALYPHMTVKENMSFALRLRKFKEDEIEKRVKEAAEILKIEHLLYRMPKEISGGQRQRVAIGRAIVRHPKVFLFDEPLSNLDAKLREEMRIEILKLYQKLNTTIVYVTHDQVEAMTLASKIVIMNKGVIQQIGTPIEVYTKPRNIFVATFIGTPTMNLIKCKLIEENNKLYLVYDNSIKFFIPSYSFPDYQKYLGKEVILGVRPDDIILDDSKIDKENAITATVDVVELLGPRENVYLRISPTKLLCATTHSFKTQPQTQMKFSLNYLNIHIFDIQSEERIN